MFDISTKYTKTTTIEREFVKLVLCGCFSAVAFEKFSLKIYFLMFKLMKSKDLLKIENFAVLK